MFRRNSHAALSTPFLKSRAFDQPGGRNFHLPTCGGKARWGFTSFPFDFGKDLWRDDWIFKERSGTSAIGVVRNNHHPFARTNGDDGLTRFGKRRRAGSAGKAGFYIRVTNRRRATGP